MTWRAPSRFYPVLDTGLCRARGLEPAAAAVALLRGGARLLQLRAKDLASGELLALADAVVAAARPYGALVIVNDRADVARMSGSGGLHVGQEDLTPEAARCALGPGVLGVSTHDERQAEGASRSAADYVAVGPIYATGTKDTGYDPRGLQLVRYAARLGKPVVAIGGITLERAPEVLSAGAAAVAVISDVLAAPDIEARAREYVARLDG